MLSKPLRSLRIFIEKEFQNEIRHQQRVKINEISRFDRFFILENVFIRKKFEKIFEVKLFEMKIKRKIDVVFFFEVNSMEIV